MHAFMHVCMNVTCVYEWMSLRYVDEYNSINKCINKCNYASKYVCMYVYLIVS